MPEIIKETVITRASSDPTVVATSSATEASSSQTIEYVVYFLFGLLETLLAFRLVLKMMGASTASGFVRSIYGITGIFIYPFEGIFSRGFAPGLETTAVFEPSTFVALIVYAVIAWGLVWLIRMFSGRAQV
jgi:hypothetical protein